MKNKLNYLSLIILPVLLYILIIYYRFSIGPSFLFSNYDGPYGLLLSSLSLADFRSPGFFQHPGIVPQLIWAFVLKLTYLFRGIDSNIVTDVINRPEFYIQTVNIIFTFLTIITLFFIGVIFYKKAGNIFAALFIQLTPFISVQLIFQLAKNTAETTTLIIMLFLISAVICFLNEKLITKKKNIIYIFTFGIICGLALANKVSILPVMIIPFLLIKKIRFKALYIFISFAIFTVLLFIFSPSISLFFRTMSKNVFSSGVNYSSGPSNFADTSQLILQSKFIFFEYTLFSIIYFLIVLTLILQFIPKFKSQVRSNKYFVFLIGIFVAMSAFILLVLKSHIGYYILPALVFSATGLFIVNSILFSLIPKFFKFCKYLYIFVFYITFVLLQTNKYLISTSYYSDRKNESFKIDNYLENNYSKSILVSTEFVTSIPTAFFHSLFYTGEQGMYYYGILQEKYPDFVYFQKWRKDFVYLRNDKELEDRLKYSSSFIFHSFNDETLKDFKTKIIDFTNKPNTTFEVLYSCKSGEKLYLVNPK